MISGISNTGVGATSSSSQEDQTSLKQADFLKLLATELQNQDPDKPMDSQAMLAQFATLSQVQSITSLEGNMASMVKHQMSMAPVTGAALIGSPVTFPSNDFTTVDGRISGLIEPPADVASVTVNLKDALGRVVDSRVIKTDEDKVSFDFEFENTESGQYTVEAVYGEEKSQAVVMRNATVDSVRYENGEMLFKLSTGQFARLQDLSTIG